MMRKTVLSLLALFLCVLTSCRMTETSGPVKESDSPASSGQNVVVIWDEKEETYQWICEIAKKIEITEIGIYEKEEYLSEVLLDAGLVIAGATGTKEDIVTLMNQVARLSSMKGKRLSSFLICREKSSVSGREDSSSAGELENPISAGDRQNLSLSDNWEDEVDVSGFDVFVLPGIALDGSRKDFSGELSRIDGWITTIFTYHK